jgi:hypothetical protein
MYESPIKVFQGNLEMQFEGEILKAVQRADITVDRDELIRALRYDREQYQKGFDDARKGAVPVVRCEDCKHLCVWNRKDMYAFCPKTNIVFLPFDKDTRTFFCSLGERKDGGDG